MGIGGTSGAGAGEVEHGTFHFEVGDHVVGGSDDGAVAGNSGVGEG